MNKNQDIPPFPQGDIQIVDQNKEPFKPGPMGPSSPEMKFSTRYFTVSFDDNNNPKIVSLNISAFNENDAISLAKSLKSKTKGWTNVYYRYNVYQIKNTTYVTVIDQGREMLPSLRVLYASIIGSIVGLLITFIVLLIVSKKLVHPIEEADRKQKQFMLDASRELKNPITVIDSDIKIIENQFGENEETKSIDKQVKKLNTLSKNLNTIAILSEYKEEISDNVNLSNTVNEIKQKYIELFKNNSINLNINVEKDLIIEGKDELVRKLINELFDNATKYSNSYCNFDIYKKENRIVIEEYNDSYNIPTGSLDRVFDKFYRLENSNDKKGTGLGLSIVKDIVNTLNGRVYATGNNGEFRIKIEL